MNYHLGGFKRVLVGAVLIGLFALLHPPLFYILHRTVLTFGKPLWSLNASLWGTSTEAEKESVLAVRVSMLEDDKMRLQTDLGYVARSKPHLANVLSSIESSPYDTFIIDQGESAGVVVGAEIASAEGVALGRVVESYPEVAKVELYSAYGRELEVLLPDGTHVQAFGAGSQNFLIKLPRGLPIKNGDGVRIPGADGLILGIVEHAEDNPGDAFQKIYLRSPLNITSVLRVYVSN